MEHIPYSYQISYSPARTFGFKDSESKIIHEVSFSYHWVITDLQPDTKYNVTICIKINNMPMSKAARAEFRTDILTRTFYTIVTGNTPNHHKSLKERLMSRNVREVNCIEDSDFILAFCVIVSRVGTDMEAALKEIPDSKPVILAVMHHTFDPDHVTPDTSRFVRSRGITVVDILFHKDRGILRCQRNTEAEQKINKSIWTCPESKKSVSLFGPLTKKNPSPARQAQLSIAAQHRETSVPKGSSNDSVLTQRGSNPGSLFGQTNGSKESTIKSNSSPASPKEFTYCVILTENTLGSHKDFQKRLAERVALPNEVSQSSVAQCSFLLVFCPVVSSVGVDVDKALKHIPDGKPSILVVMHHTFNSDYLPPESRGHVKSSNVLVVDCLFYEDTGILKCQRNDETLDKITKWIIGKFPNLKRSSQDRLTSSGGFFTRLW